MKLKAIMQKAAILFFALILCSSCKNYVKPTTVILDYSIGSSWGYGYSLKIYSDGTGYLQTFDVERSKGFWMKKNISMNILDSVFIKVKKAALADKYEQSNLQDGVFFNAVFYSDNGAVSKHYVYGDNYPALLAQVKHYCEDIRQTKGWLPLKDTVVKFSSASIFYRSKMKVDQVFFPPPIKKRNTSHSTK